MNDQVDSKYPIGYKKPPRHTRFQPGRSGNAKGRPKGAKNFATVIEQELQTPIEVTENGKRKRISKRQAIVKQTVNKAMAGDPKATLILFAEVRFHESQNPPPLTANVLVRPEDQLVMRSIVDRIRQSSSAPPDPASAPNHPSESQLSSSNEPEKGEL